MSAPFPAIPRYSRRHDPVHRALLARFWRISQDQDAQVWFGAAPPEHAIPTGFGCRVSERRQALGLSQRALAKRVGCHQATILAIEIGRIGSWTAYAAALVRELGIDQDEPANADVAA